MDQHTHTDEPSAASTLDSIRKGGQHLLMVTLRRMDDAREALMRGDFRAAMGELNGASSSLGPLANAQALIGIAGAACMIKAADLEVGMHLNQIGQITAIESSDCAAERCPGHVKVIVGDHEPIELTGDVELWVDNESAAG